MDGPDLSPARNVGRHQRRHDGHLHLRPGVSRRNPPGFTPAAPASRDEKRGVRLRHHLRDHMARDLSQCSQRDLNYAIVDEVDSILIDEARTPHIISGQSEESTEKYYQYAR